MKLQERRTFGFAVLETSLEPNWLLHYDTSAVLRAERKFSLKCSLKGEAAQHHGWNLAGHCCF